MQEARRLNPADLVTGLSSATGLQDGGFFDQARAELRALLKTHPGHLEICRRLAELHLATGRPAEAADALRRSPELARSPEALQLFGRTSHLLRNYKEAQWALQAAQALTPDRPEPLYHLGRVYLDQRRFDDAEHAFLAARDLDPRLPQPHFGLGLTYVRRGKPGDVARAEAELQAAVSSAPGFTAARRELGQLYLSRKNPTAAAEQFVAALRASRDAESCRGMALALASMGRKLEAQYHWGLYYMRKDVRPRSAAAFERMVALDPRRHESVLLLTETYFRMKQKQRGIQLLEAALKRHPREPALYERLASLHVMAGDEAAASRVCREWLRVQPDAAAPHWVLGKYAVDVLRQDEGVRELELARQRDPTNPEFAFALAVALQRRPTPENRTRATELLREAIRLGPGVARYRGQLGLALRQQGDLDGARRCFLESLEREPHEASTYTNLLDVARRQRQPHQLHFWSRLVRAVEARTANELRLWQAVWDRPADVIAYAELAAFLTRTGELAKAESQLEEALRLRPGWRPAQQAHDALRQILHVMEE